MKKSDNEQVQKFLEEILIYNEERFTIVQQIRDIVFTFHPLVQERIMYGGIMFSLEKDFGGIFLSKKHISLEFSFGFTLKDPHNLLEGAGKFRRHLKIKSLQDITDKNVEFFIKQIRKS